MSWNGRLECSTDDCGADATHVVWSDNCGPSVWCAECAADFRIMPSNWYVERLPDFAALRRDAETLRQAVRIVGLWEEGSKLASSAVETCNALRELLSNARP